MEKNRRETDIPHYNIWLTDKIRDYIRNIDNRIKFLFEPYESFNKMRSLFGLSKSYLSDQRVSKNSKKVIAQTILNSMSSNFKQYVLKWVDLHPELAELILKAQSDIINFIRNYEDLFNPKPSSHYQMLHYHPNFKSKYFSSIESVDQAYWLGYLYADGWITVEHKKSGDYFRMGFAQSVNENGVLDRFCDVIGLNKEYIKPVESICQYTSKTTQILKIRWGDQSFAQNLIDLGMTYEYNDEKEKRVKNPKLPNLQTRDLMLAFL